MKEYCVFCGSELREGAVFCTKCGKPLHAAAAQAQPARPGSPSAPKRADGKGARLERARAFTERFVLRGIALLACFVVFISGFFINIGFMPLEQVQSKINIDISGGSADIEGILSETALQQNVFNVFGALAVPLGGDEEEYQKIVDAYSACMTDVIAKYDSELTDLSLQVSAGDARAAQKLIRLCERIANEIAASVSGINFIKLDRLEAEIAFSDAGSALGQSSGGTVSENIVKRADDSLIRSIIMVGFPLGTVYLQVVSLVFMILAAIGMFTGKKAADNKFFFLYLAGFVFLFLIAQLSATTLAGTGMFCFVFVSVLFLLSLAGKVFATRGITAQKIVSLSVNGLASVLSFAALCTVFGAAFEYGGILDKVGSVFGLYAFDSTQLASGEGGYITAVNLAAYGSVYLIVLTLVSLVFFFSAARICKDEIGKASDIVLTAVAAGATLIAYMAIYIVAESSASDLLYAPAALIGTGMLLLCALVARIADGSIRQAVSRGGAPAQPVYAAPGAPRYYSAAASPASAGQANVAAPLPASPEAAASAEAAAASGEALPESGQEPAEKGADGSADASSPEAGKQD